ncbi:MAG: alpha-L-fucosidase [Armatimonadota bacterium]
MQSISRTPSNPPENFRFATEEEMQWWRDARFGMFIHWGPAAIGGGDISWCRKGGERIGDHQFVVEPQIPAEIYDNFYKEFTPTLYDAKEWVSIAKNAGMKYMILTAKHHDGFCLFDTRLTEHRVTAPNCPCQRDLVDELADACHEAGMKLGFYYSARDLYHPDYLTENHARYLAFYHAQLLELLCNFGKLDLLWFDHIGGTHDQWDPDLVLRMARTLQPGILINNRLHFSVMHGSIPEYLGDYDTPEQQLGAYRIDRAWESCLCLVGGVWSYKPGGEMMSLKECIQSLVQCAGGDGNLLLNTGPMPDGRIEPRQAERLKEVGNWLSKYGESIYSTRGGPFLPGDWGVSTHKKQTIYLHVLKTDNAVIELPPIDAKILTATVLTGGTAQFTQNNDGIQITPSKDSKNEYDTIIALHTDRHIAP